MISATILAYLVCTLCNCSKSYHMCVSLMCTNLYFQILCEYV